MVKRETRVPRRERSESHVCPLALYHFLSSERLCIHCSHLPGINFHISIKRMMHFDLLKYFLKVCEDGTALGICYPTVTKTRVIPAPSLGISCLAQLSLLPRQKIYPNHDGPNCVVSHCYWQHWNYWSAAAEVWPGMAKVSLVCPHILAVPQLKTALQDFTF